MILYLDTLALLYRAYYSTRDLVADDGFPTGALYGLTATLFRVISEMNPEHVVACFDRPERTFRQEAHEEYKSSREIPEEDLIVQIDAARGLLQSLGAHTVEMAGHEADDLLGTLAVADARNGKDCVIVSCDGDLLQLTAHRGVRVYFLRKGTRDFTLYDGSGTAEKNGYPADRIPDYKGLAGDPSDSIRGVSGIGAVSAKRLIASFGDLEGIYRALDSGQLADSGFTARVASLLAAGREQAFESRDLATIHLDVPAQASHLRAPAWRDRVDFSVARETLERYSFRTMIPRLTALVRGDDSSPDGAEDSEETCADLSERDRALLHEAAIALWVLDSSRTNATADDVLSYTDTDSADRAMRVILKRLAEEGREDVWNRIERPLIPVIDRMERNGIRFDSDGAKAISRKYRCILSSLTKKIHAAAGKEFNINSPKQLGEVLYVDLGLRPRRASKTASGGRTTKESALSQMTDDHPIVPLVLEYRHYEKLRSTYVDALPGFSGPDGRIRTHLQQNGTSSGRISSRDPNLQNIPSGGGDGAAIRDLFLATDGWSLISVDYSQMELRLAAILSRDKALLDIFISGSDVHRSVASRIFSVPERSVTDAQRGRAKTINFGILYGMGAQSLARSLGVPRAEASAFLQEYKDAFPDLFAYLDSVKAEALSSGFVATAFGRVRPIPGISSSLSFVRTQAERAAANTVAQGTAADIIKIAMVNIASFIEKEDLSRDARMLLQIHDELLFEASPKAVDSVVPAIVSAMESVYPPDGKPIPLSVDVSRGTSWGSLR